MSETSAVNKASLISAVTLLSKVPARVGITSSEYYKLTFSKSQLIVSLTAEVFGDQTVTVETAGITELNFFVDRKTLEPFLAAFQNSQSEKPFLFTHRKAGESETLTVKCGVRKAEFTQAKEVGGYGKEPKVSGSKITSMTDSFVDAISLARSYGSQDPTMGELNGIRIEKGLVLASNKISAFQYKCKTPIAQVSLPTPFVDIMLLFQKHTITFNERYCKMRSPQGYLCQILNEKASKFFPTESLAKGIRNALKAPVLIQVKAASFFTAAKRLNDIISSVVKRDLILIVSGSQGEKKIKITCASQAGEFTETVIIKNKLPKDVQMEFLLNLLLPLCDSSQVQHDVLIRCDDTPTVPYVFEFPQLVLLHGRLSK